MTLRRRQSGFTMIEVLLAIAIGGLLLTMVFSSLDSAVRQHRAVSDYSTPYAAGPAVLDAIEADLRNAYFYDMQENDSFWGADAEISGREADGMSFIACSLGHVGEPNLLSDTTFGYELKPHPRRSPTSEIQYVCRQSPDDRAYLELWRREDFHIDDEPHDGGIYRLVWPMVHALKFEYVRRSAPTGEPTGGGGGANGSSTSNGNRPSGSTTGAAGATALTEEMRQDTWHAIEEGGIPRAVIVTLDLYAREPADRMLAGKEPQVFRFQRWIPLPQVNLSADEERAIANWDGRLRVPTPPVSGRGVRDARGGGGPGGPEGEGGPGGGRGRGRGRGNQGQNPGPNGVPMNVPAGQNPFFQALQNRAPRGNSGNTTFINLFSPR